MKPIPCSHISRTTDFGAERVGREPRVPLAVGLVERLEQVGERLGPGHVLDQGHPLVVLDALGLERGDRLAARGVLLGVQQRPWRLQHRLDHRHHVEGERLGLRVEHVEHREREVGQRLVEREVRGQRLGQDVTAAEVVGLVEPGEYVGATRLL